MRKGEFMSVRVQQWLYLSVYWKRLITDLLITSMASTTAEASVRFPEIQTRSIYAGKYKDWTPQHRAVSGLCFPFSFSSSLLNLFLYGYRNIQISRNSVDKSSVSFWVPQKECDLRHVASLLSDFLLKMNSSWRIYLLQIVWIVTPHMFQYSQFYHLLTTIKSKG